MVRQHQSNTQIEREQRHYSEPAAVSSTYGVRVLLAFHLTRERRDGPSRGNEDQQKRRAEEQSVYPGVAAGYFYRGNQGSEKAKRQRNSPVEATDFRAQPRVRLGHDFASFIRIRARGLESAQIAGTRRGAVHHYMPPMVDCGAGKKLAGGTLPNVELTAVIETCLADTMAPAAAMPGQVFQH